MKVPAGKLTVVLALLVVGGFMVFNWQSLLFASAATSSDQRPVLLRDAEWNKPETAEAFRQRFGQGSSEASLVQWLDANAFASDKRAHRATLRVRGVPCAEKVVVTWTANNGNISRAEATVLEAGCL